MPEPWKSRGTFLVLLALKDGAKHGYEIVGHLSERTQGVFSMALSCVFIRSSPPAIGRVRSKRLLVALARACRAP